jgi:hypothetical protein
MKIAFSNFKIRYSITSGNYSMLGQMVKPPNPGEERRGMRLECVWYRICICQCVKASWIEKQQRKRENRRRIASRKCSSQPLPERLGPCSKYHFVLIFFTVQPLKLLIIQRDYITRLQGSYYTCTVVPFWLGGYCLMCWALYCAVTVICYSKRGVDSMKWQGALRRLGAPQKHRQPSADQSSPDSSTDPKTSAHFVTSTSLRLSIVKTLDLRTSCSWTLHRNSTKISATSRSFYHPPHHPFGSGRDHLQHSHNRAPQVLGSLFSKS